MTTTAVSTEVIDEVVQSIWGTVLGLLVKPVLPPSPLEETPCLSACVHITGAWNGALLFWPSERFATRATAILFAMPENEVSADDIRDGMAELGNIIAGNLKSVLPRPSRLSLPTVTRGPQHEVFVRRTRVVVQLDFVCEGERLSIQLLEGTAKNDDFAESLQISA